MSLTGKENPKIDFLREVYAQNSEETNKLFAPAHNLYFVPTPFPCLYFQQDFPSFPEIKQKQILKEKVECYNPETSNDPEKYYKCIDEIDRNTREGAHGLFLKFGQIEKQDRECLINCKLEFIDELEKERKECMLQCTQNHLNSTKALYEAYYTYYLGKNPEFKTLNLK